MWYTEIVGLSFLVFCRLCYIKCVVFLRSYPSAVWCIVACWQPALWMNRRSQSKCMRKTRLKAWFEVRLPSETSHIYLQRWWRHLVWHRSIAEHRNSRQNVKSILCGDNIPILTIPIIMFPITCEKGNKHPKTIYQSSTNCFLCSNFVSIQKTRRE